MAPDGGDRLENWLARAGASVAEGATHLWREGREVGEWTVAGYVGRGGSAEVYCARHRRLGTPAVLKVLWRDGAGPRERFDRETRFLMEAPGPAFPAFFGAGVEEGRPWIAMELLEEYPLPHRDAAVASYLLDVARGVAELHRRGWVHRDLKPRNILRRADGHAVLVDFGLLKRAGETVAGETAAGRVSPSVVDGAEVGVGTPGYAAPEQFAGGAPTPATDVHALGILADECFAGNPPRAWERIIRKATASLPRQRYPDAIALSRAIRRRHRRRNVLLTILAFVAVALLLPLPDQTVEQAPQDDARAPSINHIEVLPGGSLKLERNPSGGVTLRLGGRDANAEEKAIEIPRAKTPAATEPAPKPFRNTVAGLLDDLAPIPGKGSRIGRHEVTQAQWKALMGGICPSRFAGDDLPADSVTLTACAEFFDRLNALPVVKKKGIWFRLPFADEWKAAARGRGETEKVRLERGWFAENSDGRTHPVGTRAATDGGLFDLRGNVWELTMTHSYEVHNGFLCMGGSWADPVSETGTEEAVASPQSDWLPVRNGSKDSGEPGTLGFRVCVDASPRLPGR